MMTRNASAELTRTTAEQHNALREQLKAGLATMVLDTENIFFCIFLGVYDSSIYKKGFPVRFRGNGGAHPHISI